MLCVESLVRFRGVYLHTHLDLLRLRFISKNSVIALVVA